MALHPILEVGEMVTREESSSDVSEETRQELVHATDRITGGWGVTNAQLEVVLKVDTWPPTSLEVSAETVERVNVLISIYVMLHTLYSGALPDAWMTIVNRNPVFGGRRPIDTVIENPDHLEAVHALLAGYMQGR